MKDKTNAMRKLAGMKIDYKDYDYTDTGAVSGVEVAEILGQNPAQVFKTLVTTGRTGAHYVFMIPVAEELDLKKAAAHAGEKSLEMLSENNRLAWETHRFPAVPSYRMNGKLLKSIENIGVSQQQLAAFIEQNL